MKSAEERSGEAGWCEGGLSGEWRLPVESVAPVLLAGQLRLQVRAPPVCRQSRAYITLNGETMFQYRVLPVEAIGALDARVNFAFRGACPWLSVKVRPAGRPRLRTGLYTRTWTGCRQPRSLGGDLPRLLATLLARSVQLRVANDDCILAYQYSSLQSYLHFTALMFAVADFPPAGHFSRRELLSTLVIYRLKLIHSKTAGSEARRSFIAVGLDLEALHVVPQEVVYRSRFDQQWIGRGGPIAWPARSPDLTSVDYFLWGHMKGLIYQTSVESEKELLAPIIAAADLGLPGIGGRVCQNIVRRYRVCVDVTGRHIKPFFTSKQYTSTTVLLQWQLGTVSFSLGREVPWARKSLAGLMVLVAHARTQPRCRHCPLVPSPQSLANSLQSPAHWNSPRSSSGCPYTMSAEDMRMSSLQAALIPRRMVGKMSTQCSVMWQHMAALSYRCMRSTMPLAAGWNAVVLKRVMPIRLLRAMQIVDLNCIP
ncbi:hypothetical protein PR048_001058 [Dryococelus australis]|uniref:Uncharacterized protein n=1 Tax=Dryococelus australis TaxID=614101 RepID=A0ABQ9IGD8_9NEOP|nr:hypothetical protein PR048_001058 [Dryococelus australis]